MTTKSGAHPAFSITLPAALFEQVEQMRAERAWTRSFVIQEALHAYLRLVERAHAEGQPAPVSAEDEFSPAEIARIRKAAERGTYLPWAQVKHDLATIPRKASRKRAKTTPRAR